MSDRDAEIDSLQVNVEQLQQRVRRLEDALDTRATPLWKRLLFLADGWPSWPFVVDAPAWRPWRRWFRS